MTTRSALSRPAPSVAGAVAGLRGERLWALVREAAGDAPRGPAEALARQCAGAGTRRMGWVSPPPWPVVESAVDAVRQALGASADRGVLVLGTGGWSFAVQALVELPVPGSPRNGAAPVRPLDSLDPDAIRRAVRGEQAPRGGYLAISGSGSTMETRCLAAVVPALENGSAGADDDFSGSPIWLRDRAAPPRAFALSPRGVADQVAMLGAPLSTGFLAPAALTDPEALARGYADLLDSHHRIGIEAAELATRTDPTGTPLVSIRPPGWAGEGLRLWLLQLGRQVLCGKSAGFRPQVEVEFPSASGIPCDQATLDLSGVQPGLAGLLRLMYLAGVFVACLALRAGIRPAEHPNVAVYKRLLDRPSADIAAPPTVLADDLPGFAADWLLDRPDLTSLHVVRYGGDLGSIAGAQTFSAATGRRSELHLGTAWNHHSFQAVYADPATAVLVITAPAADRPGPGPQADPLNLAAGTLRRIAEATHAALPGRSALIQCRTAARPGPEGD